MTSDPQRFQRGRGRRWAASAAAAVGVRLAAPAIGFLLTPYLLAELGREGFGLYALSLGMAAWLGAIDLGLTPGLRVLLARRSSHLDPAALERAVSSTAAGQLVLAAVTLALGGALAVAAPWLSDDPRIASRAVVELVGLLAVGSAVSVAAHFYSGALEAHQLGYVDRLARLARTVTRAAAAVVLLEAGLGLQALGWAHVIAAVVGAAALRWGARRSLPELRVRLRAARWESVKATARVGLWLSAGAAAGVLIVGVDRAVVAKLLSLEAVAVLAVSAALFLLAESLLTHALDAGRPLLAQALGAGDAAEAARLYRPTCAATPALSIAAAGAAYAANPAFVAAWTGSVNHGGAALDAALAAALVLQVWTVPHRAALAAALDVRRPTLVRLGEGLLNLPVSVGLAALLGLPGVIAGTALAALATSAWALPRLACRRLGLPANEMLWTALRAAPVALLLAPAAHWARELGLSVGGFAGAAVAAALTLAAAAPLIWLVGLDAGIRRELRSPFAFAS